MNQFSFLTSRNLSAQISNALAGYRKLEALRVLELEKKFEISIEMHNRAFQDWAAILDDLPGSPSVDWEPFVVAYSKVVFSHPEARLVPSMKNIFGQDGLANSWHHLVLLHQIGMRGQIRSFPEWPENPNDPAAGYRWWVVWRNTWVRCESVNTNWETWLVHEKSNLPKEFGGKKFHSSSCPSRGKGFVYLPKHGTDEEKSKAVAINNRGSVNRSAGLRHYYVDRRLHVPSDLEIVSEIARLDQRERRMKSK